VQILYERAISDHNRTAERQKFRIIKIQDGGRISTEKLLRQMLYTINCYRDERLLSRAIGRYTCSWVMWCVTFVVGSWSHRTLLRYIHRPDISQAS